MGLQWLLTAFSCSPRVAWMTPILNRILEVSAIFSNSSSAASNSLLSYCARAVTHVSISCCRGGQFWGFSSGSKEEYAYLFERHVVCAAVEAAWAAFSLFGGKF